MSSLSVDVPSLQQAQQKLSRKEAGLKLSSCGLSVKSNLVHLFMNGFVQKFQNLEVVC